MIIILSEAIVTKHTHWGHAGKELLEELSPSLGNKTRLPGKIRHQFDDEEDEL